MKRSAPWIVEDETKEFALSAILTNVFIAASRRGRLTPLSASFGPALLSAK